MVNKVTLIGRIGYFNKETFKEIGDTYVMSFSLATNNKRLDRKTNEYIEDTTWHNINVWGKTASYCRDFLVKGDLLYVEGSIKQDKYIKDGEERKTYSITAFNIKKLTPSEQREDNKKYNKTNDKDSYDKLPF